MMTKLKYETADATGHPGQGAECAGTSIERMVGPSEPSASWRRHLATGWLCLAVLGPVGASVGCSELRPAPPVPSEASCAKPSGILAAGDEISVTFSAAPELNTKQKIQPNGKVSLPTVGDVSAAGKTVSGLREHLTVLYQAHLQDPTVMVSLAGAAAGVYVSGEVLRPGKIPLDRPMTALEAVMEAGGFTKLANPKQVFVVRNQEGKSQRYVLNLNQALYDSESIPFYVRAYDVIYVKQSNW